MGMRIIESIYKCVRLDVLVGPSKASSAAAPRIPLSAPGRRPSFPDGRAKQQAQRRDENIRPRASPRLVQIVATASLAGLAAVGFARVLCYTCAILCGPSSESRMRRGSAHGRGEEMDCRRYCLISHCPSSRPCGNEGTEIESGSCTQDINGGSEIDPGHVTRNPAMDTYDREHEQLTDVGSAAIVLCFR